MRSRGKNDSNITNLINEATVCGKGKTKSWSSSYTRVKKQIQLEICTVNVNVSGFDPQDCRFVGG